MSEKHTPESTLAITTEIVLPNDTNTLGNLMGGKLLHWMDVIAAISAHRLCKRVSVTASVNNVSFNAPIKLGDIVTLVFTFNIFFFVVRNLVCSFSVSK